MPIWGDVRITWRQVLPPVAVIVAIVCAAFAARLWFADEAGVAQDEQYRYYMQQLENPDPAMVAKAIERLGDLGEAEAIEPIRPKLDHADPRVVGAACGALGKLGDEAATDRILAALSHGNPIVAAGAAAGAGGLKLEQATEPLIGLLDSQNVYVRLAAVEALGAIGGSKALPALERLEARPAAGLRPAPGDDQRAALAEAVGKALASLRGVQ